MFSMADGIYAHFVDMLATRYQSNDWTQHATCKLQATFRWENLLVSGTMYENLSHDTSHDLNRCFDLQLDIISVPEAITLTIDRPMVHTRDREPVPQVGSEKNFTTKIPSSNYTGVYSLVWLPKFDWWDLMKVETAVKVMAGLVWSFSYQRIMFWITLYFLKKRPPDQTSTPISSRDWLTARLHIHAHPSTKLSYIMTSLDYKRYYLLV